MIYFLREFKTLWGWESMFRIGICDDDSSDCMQMENLCDRYLKGQEIEYQFVVFKSGEDLLHYCENKSSKRIDLLFLDVELCGIDGIMVKEQVAKRDCIWRIVFVSCHVEVMPMAFGLKTLGFVTKPPAYSQIAKWTALVLEELEENIVIRFEGLTEDILLEDIEYLEGDRSYVIIHLHKNGETRIIARNLKYVENKLSGLPVVRVHKSYIVNLQHVTEMAGEVRFQNNRKSVPVGRVFRENALHRYQEYVKKKVRKRL